MIEQTQMLILDWMDGKDCRKFQKSPKFNRHGCRRLFFSLLSYFLLLSFSLTIKQHCHHHRLTSCVSLLLKNIRLLKIHFRSMWGCNAFAEANCIAHCHDDAMSVVSQTFPLFQSFFYKYIYSFGQAQCLCETSVGKCKGSIVSSEENINIRFTNILRLSIVQ